MKARILAIISTVAVLTSFPARNGKAVRPGPSTPHLAQQRKPNGIELITADELKAKLTNNEPVAVLDVRAADEFANSTSKIRGSLHVKTRKLKYRLTKRPLSNLSHEAEVVTYCACPSDEASMYAAQILLDAGFKHVRVLKGGWNEWIRVNGPVEAKPKGL